MLRPSSVCCLLSLLCTECIVAKRCDLEQKLLLTAYRKPYRLVPQMNDIDICSEVVSRSCQPLRYIRRWIYRKPLEIEVWFQRTTKRKWHMGYQTVTWLMTSCDPQRCSEAVRSTILATAWLLVDWSTRVTDTQRRAVELCTYAAPRYNQASLLTSDSRASLMSKHQR